MRPLTFAIVILIPAALNAADFFVAPDGHDDHPGTRELPFATLHRARDAVRVLKKSGALRDPVNVWIADGQYLLDEPFELTPEDSGTVRSPITYQAVPGARPRFGFGRKVQGWKRGSDGVWFAEIPDVASGDWYFEQLFVNGQRAVRARTPNKFYFYIQDIREEVFSRGSGAVAESARQVIWMRSQDYDLCFGEMTAAELPDVQILAFHKWDNTRRFIERLDPDEKSFESSGKGMKSWNPLKRGTRYIVENYRAALDAPGEWFLSRTGTLYYKPVDGVDPATAEFVAPLGDRFIRIDGRASGNDFVQHVKIRGLIFRHSQWLTPRSGFEPQQAAATVEAAVLVDGARHVTLEDCEFSRIGSYGVWFRTGCSNCSLKRCLVAELGAGGVRIGDVRIPKDEAKLTHHITVDNNIIRHGGRILPCAVGVWIGHSGDNSITHNEIADFYYTGISAGWNWGYGASPAKRNIISFNHVHHLGWGVLSDMGGIYTLGRSEGTEVCNNVFHDIYSYSYGGWGLYTDQASTGILFENNLVYRTKTGGFHQHFGKDNIVRNNILAYSQEQQLQATRAEEHRSFEFAHNIIVYDSETLLHGAWRSLKYDSHHNCYWHSGEQAVSFLGDTLEQWQVKGHEQDSIIADPGFARPKEGDFSLPDDSAAFSVGFTPFDPQEAGVYGNQAWVDLAAAVNYAPLEVAPAAPPLSIRDDFERDVIGQPPSGLTAHVEKKGDSIVVTEDTAASGTHSVKITDAEGLSRAFYPYMTVGGPHYTSGSVVCSFALRFDKASDVQIELRDYSGSGYAAGPSFQIRRGTLTISSDLQRRLPSDEWVRFEIETKLGDSGNWTLRVDIPGEEKIEYASLPFRDPRFAVLTWVGVISAANHSTSFYLDDFRLHEK